MNDMPAETTAASFRFGEFTYDSASHLLLRNGMPQHLSPKAQQMLHLLLSAQPRALSREELYDALWPSTYVCETNIAGVVNEIRRALGDRARAGKFIRTVHGFGYAFCGEVTSTAYVPVVAHLVCGEVSYLLHHGENVVGRAFGADVVLSDGTVSRRHAAITLVAADSTVSVKDLGSKNGTYVDGKKIGDAPVVVARRARIHFGAVVCSIVWRRSTATRPGIPNLTAVSR